MPASKNITISEYKKPDLINESLSTPVKGILNSELKTKILLPLMLFISKLLSFLD